MNESKMSGLESPEMKTLHAAMLAFLDKPGDADGPHALVAAMADAMNMHFGEAEAAKRIMGSLWYAYLDDLSEYLSKPVYRVPDEKAA
jgi:hypothetical protein